LIACKDAGSHYESGQTFGLPAVSIIVIWIVTIVAFRTGGGVQVAGVTVAAGGIFMVDAVAVTAAGVRE
jgi:hypothetical protein